MIVSASTVLDTATSSTSSGDRPAFCATRATRPRTPSSRSRRLLIPYPCHCRKPPGRATGSSVGEEDVVPASGANPGHRYVLFGHPCPNQRLRVGSPQVEVWRPILRGCHPARAGKDVPCLRGTLRPYLVAAGPYGCCLLYTSDAADDLLCV